DRWLGPPDPRPRHHPAALGPCRDNLRRAGWDGRDDLRRLPREYRGGGSLRAGWLRSRSPAGGRPGDWRGRPAFEGPPASFWARYGSRGITRLSRRRVRGRGLSSARRTRLSRLRGSWTTDLSLLHARGQDALSLRFSSRVP